MVRPATIHRGEPAQQRGARPCVLGAGAGKKSVVCERYCSRQDSVTNWLPYFVSCCVIASPE